MKEFNITPAHEKFVLHYCQHSNATQAYLFAYPHVTYNTAKNEGPLLKERPEIKELIEAKKEAFAIEYDVSREKVIQRLLKIADKCEENNNMTAAVKVWQEINRMVGNLAAHKIEHSGNMPIAINLNLNDEDESEVDGDSAEDIKPETP